MVKIEFVWPSKSNRDKQNGTKGAYGGLLEAQNILYFISKGLEETQTNICSLILSLMQTWLILQVKLHRSLALPCIKVLFKKLQVISFADKTFH